MGIKFYLFLIAFAVLLMSSASASDAECQTNINVKIIDFPMDFTIPIFMDIYIGDQTCNFASFWKWFVRIKKTTEDNYYIDGIRTWIFALAIFILIAFLFIRKYRKNLETERFK